MRARSGAIPRERELAMDDELSAARRRGALRKLLWPRGEKHKGFMHGRRWMGVALVLLVCALTTVGIVLFSGGETEQKSEGNAGVLCLYDFFRTNEDNKELKSGEPVNGLVQRLLSEPFEVSAQMMVESEGLKSFGIPFTTLPADFLVKYDLRDIGAKLSVIGMDIFGACASGDQLVIVGSDGEASVTKLPTSSDLSADMTLENRIGAFLPGLPGGIGGYKQVFDMLAQSVPEECTELRLGRAYSPKDGEDVNVTMVSTTLDADELAQTAVAFVGELVKDEALYEQAEPLIAALAEMLGLEDASPETLLLQLQGTDFDGVILSWKVFRRDETPIGLRVSVATTDTQFDLTRMAELDGNMSFEYAQLCIDGSEALRVDVSTKDKKGVFSGNAFNADGKEIRFNGTFELEPYTDDAYSVEMDVDASGFLFSDQEDTAHAEIDARIDIGNGLGMLKDSEDWQDIFAEKDAD